MNTPRQKNISIDKDLLGQVEALCAVLHTNFSSKTKEPIGGVENQRTQPIEREGPRVVRAVLRVSAHEKGARRLLGVAYFFVGGEMPHSSREAFKNATREERGWARWLPLLCPSRPTCL